MRENPTVSISQFTSKIIRYLHVFQDYCQTSEFDLFCEKYVEDPNITMLDDKTKVRQELIDYLIPLKEDLLTYKYDFYKMKSVEDIADKIGVNADRAKAYIERNKLSFSKDQIKNLSELEGVTLKTQVKEIGSYKILKELQLIERNLLLSKATAQRQRVES